MVENTPSIEYLELYALTVAVVLWLHRFKNRNIYLFCDNESIVNMVNSSSSSCKNCMLLIRLVVMEGLVHNTKVKCKQRFNEKQRNRRQPLET